MKKNLIVTGGIFHPFEETSNSLSNILSEMDYVSEIKEGDEIVDQDDIRVVIDPKAILYLLGTEMDYVEDKFSSGFKFNNPNEVSACGCGESVEIVPLDTVTKVSTAS